MNSGVSLECENLLFQKLDLYLFNLFGLSSYNDDVEEVKLRLALLIGNVIIIEEEISGVYSSLTKM